MKRILVSMFLLVFSLCLVGCNLLQEDKNVTCQKYENCTVFKLDNFPAKETISFELERKGLGEGQIYYLVNLVTGALSVNYQERWHDLVQPLGEFSADDEKTINGSGGYVEGDKITIIFESDSDVSGEIIIAFTEESLNEVINYPCENNAHQWDDGIEIEGGNGAYAMKYICELCGNTKEETITIIHPEIKPFYSLQEALNNQFLTHDQLELIANLYNNTCEEELPKLDSLIEQKILEEFCLINDISYGLDNEIPGNIRFFGQYNTGWWDKTCYIVMIDNILDYGKVISEEIVDGITFNYDTTQRITVWIEYK